MNKEIHFQWIMFKSLPLYIITQINVASCPQQTSAISPQILDTFASPRSVMDDLQLQLPVLPRCCWLSPFSSLGWWMVLLISSHLDVRHHGHQNASASFVQLDASCPQCPPRESLLELRLATCQFIQFPMLPRGNFFVAAHDISFSTSVTASCHHNTIAGLLENQLGDDASNIGLAKCNEKHGNWPSWSKGLPTLINQFSAYYVGQRLPFRWIKSMYHHCISLSIWFQ